MEPYHIRTEVFEGPLDLLLSLIEKRKLLINDISLADVANDYLSYLEQHPEFPVSETAQFVLTGSTLLLIKSKSLLPVLSLTEEEQMSIEDLEVRLKVLDRFKTAGRALAAHYHTSPLFMRKSVRRREISFSPLKDMSTDALHASMLRVLQNLPKEKAALPQKVVEQVMSLEDMMDQLSARISKGMQVSFRQFARVSEESKVNVIVSFLAMLELVRQGAIRVEQESQHGDIHMQTDTVGVPNYG